MIKGISITDWIAVAVGVLGAIAAILGNSKRLPASARKWLSKLGTDSILAVIVKAQTIANKTPEERRKWVVSELQDLAVRRTGIMIPTSIANLLVEFAYQQYKKRMSK